MGGRMKLKPANFSRIIMFFIFRSFEFHINSRKMETLQSPCSLSHYIYNCRSYPAVIKHSSLYFLLWDHRLTVMDDHVSEHISTVQHNITESSFGIWKHKSKALARLHILVWFWPTLKQLLSHIIHRNTWHLYKLSHT